MTLHKVGFEERKDPLGSKRWIEWCYETEYYFDDEACVLIRKDYRVYPKIAKLMSGIRSKMLDMVVKVDDLERGTTLQLRIELKKLLDDECLPERGQRAIKNILEKST